MMHLLPPQNSWLDFIFAYVGISLMVLSLFYGLVVRAVEDSRYGRRPRNRVRIKHNYIAVGLLIIIGVLLSLGGIVFGQVQYLNGQEQRTTQVQHEAKRVYGLVLSHDQAAELYSSSTAVSLNDGTKIILQHVKGNDWVLATPNSPTPLTAQ